MDAFDNPSVSVRLVDGLNDLILADITTDSPTEPSSTLQEEAFKAAEAAVNKKLGLLRVTGATHLSIPKDLVHKQWPQLAQHKPQEVEVQLSAPDSICSCRGTVKIIKPETDGLYQLMGLSSLLAKYAGSYASLDMCPDQGLLKLSIWQAGGGDSGTAAAVPGASRSAPAAPVTALALGGWPAAAVPPPHAASANSGAGASGSTCSGGSPAMMHPPPRPDARVELPKSAPGAIPWPHIAARTPLLLTSPLPLPTPSGLRLPLQTPPDAMHAALHRGADASTGARARCQSLDGGQVWRQGLPRAPCVRSVSTGDWARDGHGAWTPDVHGGAPARPASADGSGGDADARRCGARRSSSPGGHCDLGPEDGWFPPGGKRVRLSDPGHSLARNHSFDPQPPRKAAPMGAADRAAAPLPLASPGAAAADDAQLVRAGRGVPSPRPHMDVWARAQLREQVQKREKQVRSLTEALRAALGPDLHRRTGGTHGVPVAAEAAARPTTHELQLLLRVLQQQLQLDVMPQHLLQQQQQRFMPQSAAKAPSGAGGAAACAAPLPTPTHTHAQAPPTLAPTAPPLLSWLPPLAAGFWGGARLGPWGDGEAGGHRRHVGIAGPRPASHAPAGCAPSAQEHTSSCGASTPSTPQQRPCPPADLATYAARALAAFASAPQPQQVQGGAPPPYTPRFPAEQGGAAPPTPQPPPAQPPFPGPPKPAPRGGNDGWPVLNVTRDVGAIADALHSTLGFVGASDKLTVLMRGWVAKLSDTDREWLVGDFYPRLSAAVWFQLAQQAHALMRELVCRMLLP